MIKKEVSEIKKQFKPSDCTISRICTCYVNGEKEILSTSTDAFLSLPEEECFKYFEIFKKSLSGSIGKNLMWDEGIVSQTIMLSAVEKGYGGCMIGSCKRVEILEAVELDPQRYSLALVLALGKPKEEVRMVPVGEDGSTTYYRDENQVHYVPKRQLKDVLL